MTIEHFIKEHSRTAGAETANEHRFILGLCELLNLPKPEGTVADETKNLFVFQKAVKFNNGDGTTSDGRIDLYKAGCFVWESKQGADAKAREQAEALATATKQKRFRRGTAQRGTAQWGQAMRAAFQQAKRYAEALPEWPPILVVCDIGYCFDIYADFSGTGKNYQQFPDPSSYRIPLQNLAKPDVQSFLKAIWTDPQSLDPSKKSARVTRELADRLARLARSLETGSSTGSKKSLKPDHPVFSQTAEETHDKAHKVAQFLMRCLFTMFAEEETIELLPKGSFQALLERLKNKPENFVPMIESLWRDMDKGGFNPIVEEKVRKFNGGLFADCSALPLNRDQIELLLEAAKANWADVEPAIFGTLLERALDARERHKLGAHYTPRAYVERLVMPTIIEPLRDEWENVYATATALYENDKASDAQDLVKDFLEKLCHVRVLDPACGSGNFLYVSLELMKRLEGEVTQALEDFGASRSLKGLVTVDPHQFLGIEVNPRAAAIADLVLWIGYLKWHIRSLGRESISEPIIRKFDNIECRDAVLAWDLIEPVVDADGNPVTRWDGHTTKKHPVTGEEVPNDTARVQELRYINPRKADWPEADYIVGNPPFIGNFKMREVLGNGYTIALRGAFPDLAESCDYVMNWWHQAATLTRCRKVVRFGLIATNSLRQPLNRRGIQPHLDAPDPLSITFAIPDHPWVDSAEGAAVRISMTVGESGNHEGILLHVAAEKDLGEIGADILFSHSYGKIQQDLRIGADVASTSPLRANQGLSSMGVKLHGAGFEVPPASLSQVGGVGDIVRRFIGGRDLAQQCRERYVIDFFGLAVNEARSANPRAFQWVVDNVKPHRDQSREPAYQENWWLFGRPRAEFRNVLAGLTHMFATPRTAKHRFFVSLPSDCVFESEVIGFAIEDLSFLAVMSSRIHIVWAITCGGTLEDRPRYNNSLCFDKFPFPEMQGPVRQRLRSLGDALDAHRKRQQELHPDLTMTGMYNVLEKLRAAEAAHVANTLRRVEREVSATPSTNRSSSSPAATPPADNTDDATDALVSAERDGYVLTPKEREIHEKGLVSVLKQIHDELDAAVFDAYGWPHNLSDEEILERLVALNHERAEEEKRGLIRWLRPEFQNPAGGKPSVQNELALEDDSEDEESEESSSSTSKKKPSAKKGKGKSTDAAAKKSTKETKSAWPKKLPEQIAAVRQALQSHKGPAAPDIIASRFKTVKPPAIEELLDTLVAVGQARQTKDGRYVV